MTEFVTTGLNSVKIRRNYTKSIDFWNGNNIKNLIVLKYQTRIGKNSFGSIQRINQILSWNGLGCNEPILSNLN